MRKTPKSEIQRLNDEIVGYLLLNRSPPKALVAAREEALARAPAPPRTRH